MQHFRLFVRVLGLGVLWALPAHGDDGLVRFYDVPAGEAAAVFRKFSDISGREILFAAEAVRGLRTNAVRGQFTARAALDRMLAGTPFQVREDAKTGALAITRVGPIAAKSGNASSASGPRAPPPSVDNPPMTKSHALLGALSALFISAGSANLPAQTADQAAAAPPEASASPSDQVIRMDQFEIVTTQGHGYMATNAAEAFKTNQALLDIPQIDTVITNDVLHDLGAENLSEITNYFGAYQYFSSDDIKTRGGLQTTQIYADEVPIHAGWTDDTLVDTVEEIRGGAEGLYMLNSNLGGIIMKSMKKPLPYTQDILSLSVDQLGLYHTWFDATGPLGKIGDVSIDYRLIVGYQDGKRYLSNVIDDRQTLYPYFQAKYKDTIVRVHFDAENVKGAETGENLMTPSGLLYTGAGWSTSNNPPNNMNQLWTETLEATLLQSFSDSWEMRFTGQYHHSGQFGPQANPSGYDWDRGDLFYANRLNDDRWFYWTALGDMTGRYDLGPSNWEMKNTDSFGWAFSDQVTEKYVLTSSTVAHFSDTSQGIPLIPGQSASSFAVPFNSAAAINSIVVPPQSSYYVPATSGGSHATVWIGGFYWQHTVEVVPKWFDIIAGLSWVDVVTDTVADVTQTPWMAQEVHGQQWVHRFAGVFHVGPNASIYALTSTNFSPPSTISNYFANGLPNTVPMQGKDNELGFKTAFLGGRISTDFSWFEMLSTNIAETAGVFANGQSYVALVGEGVEEGVDGDFAFTPLPGWQLVGTYYAGHAKDQNNNPISGSWDNSFGILTRYSFPQSSILKGLTVGGGLEWIGGRWASDSGIIDAAGLLPANGLIKAKTGQMTNAFVQYAFNRHLTVGVYCTNVLNEAFAETASVAGSDPTIPRWFRFEASYKF